MGMVKEIDGKVISGKMTVNEYCEQKFLGGNEQTLN